MVDIHTPLGFGGSLQHQLTELRRASRIPRLTRFTLQEHRNDLLDELDRLDDELGQTASRRRELLGRLTDLRDRLWPRVRGFHGRRPPVHYGPPLRPTVANPVRLRGWGLRHAIIAILRRHGELELREVHDFLHLYGYAVDRPDSVKALADAAGSEERRGRLTRVRRGRYAYRQGYVPLPRVDPGLWNDPETWGLG